MPLQKAGWLFSPPPSRTWERGSRRRSKGMREVYERPPLPLWHPHFGVLHVLAMRSTLKSYFLKE